MGFFYGEDDFDTTSRGLCGSCPLYDSCNKLPSLITPQSEILVILEKPTQKENGSGSSFSSSLFRSFLSFIPKRLFEKMSFSYAVRGYIEGTVVHSDIYESCFRYLDSEIDQVKPKVVLGLGSIPLKWANSDFDSISKFNQVYFPKIKNGHSFWYYPIFDIPSTLGLSKYPKPYDIAFKNNMKSFIKFYENLPNPSIEISYNDNIKILKSSDNVEKEIDEVFEAAKDTGAYAGLDIETEGTPFSHKFGLLTASLGCREKTIAFSVNHPTDPNPGILPILSRKLRENDWLHHSPYELFWFSCLFGEEWLYEASKSVSIYDTMPYARIVHSRSGILDLGTLTDIHLGFNVKKLSHVDASKDWKMYSLWEWLSYNALDSKYDSILFDHLCRNYPLDDTFMQEFLTLCELSIPFVIAQKRGLLIDKEETNRLHDTFITKQEGILHDIYSLDVVKDFIKQAGHPFNVNSNFDIIFLMKTFFNIDMKRKSKKAEEEDKETADEEMLGSIPESISPLPSLVLDYRHIAKSLTTYINPIINKKIMYPDGRIHPQYSTTSVITGRRSSRAPNAQNMPSRTDKYIRNMITADDGEVLLAFDYGQLEARVIAMASKDPRLVAYQREDYDIHAHWRNVVLRIYPKYVDILVSKVGKLPEDRLMKEGRKEIKTYFVFASLYGSTSDNCADRLGLPRDVMKKIAQLFWDDFKGVIEYRKKLQLEYERTGYVYNLLRTRRRGGAIVFNEMINFPIQSTASDIVRSAAIRLIDYAFQNNMPWICPRIEIHDDLSMSIPVDKVEASEKIISDIMLEPVFDFINVPLVVESSVGKSWGNLKSGSSIKGKIFGCD